MSLNLHRRTIHKENTHEAEKNDLKISEEQKYSSQSQETNNTIANGSLSTAVAQSVLQDGEDNSPCADNNQNVNVSSLIEY